MTVKGLIPILKEEESKIKMEKEDKKTKDDLKGLVARSNFKSSFIHPNISKRMCHGCLKTNHLVKDCPRVRDAKARGTVICYSCQAEGHTSSSCEEHSNRQSSGGGNNQECE